MTMLMLPLPFDIYKNISKLQVYSVATCWHFKLINTPGVAIQSGGLNVFVNIILSKLLWFGNLKEFIKIVIWEFVKLLESVNN